MSNKKFGLALGSGAWRGLAHIGVLKSLSQNNIPIDFIAGSSIGAIIGGMYAVTNDIAEIERIANGLSFKSILQSVFQKPSGRIPALDTEFDRFFKNIIGDIKIEDLKIPYCAVASNLLTGQLMAINKGSLITAMKASSAVPLFFKPVKISENYFLDGGMVAPIPVDTVRQMGADVVMGVNLYGGVFPVSLDNSTKISRIQSGKICRFILLKKLSELNLASADIPLDLKIPNEDYGFFAKFLNNQEVVDFGYQSANAIIGEIKKKLS
jgi:NTE family protein